MPTKHDAGKTSHAPSVFAGEIEGFTHSSKLSRRETDIVVALIRNITNSEEIAKALGISTHTVNNHLKSIFEKTSTNSKTEILASFLRYAADRLQRRNVFARRPKVLVIGDEAVLCSFIGNGLRDRGVKTYTLTDPSRAVEIIGKFAIDFVVCDSNMNECSGIDLLKQVRATYPSWPSFLFITGYPSHILEECMHYGAAACVEKPLDIDQLFRTLMGYLVEAPDERARLLGIDLGAAVTLPMPCVVTSTDLGYGGAFIPLDGGLQKKYRLNVGGVVDLTLAPEHASATIKARGRIVWKRATDENGLQAGVGMQFLDLSDHDQFLLDEMLKTSDTISYIPMGGAPHHEGLVPTSHVAAVSEAR